ncbi:MAG: discoidin domain-containing protein [Rectinema sp.]|nr:discoidin domain-containing protein [Rectinema sp.]
MRKGVRIPYIVAAAILLATVSCDSSLFGEFDNPLDPQSQYYVVVYDSNGATGGSVPIDSTTYLQGATVTVLGNTGNLTRTGYSFAGWNTKADGTGTSYQAWNTFVMGSANVTLYAQWTPNNIKNVALSSMGATASAISVGTYLAGPQYASYAIDGNPNTSWASNWDMPAWLQVKFDRTYTISKIGVWWDYHRHDYIIKLSTDGTTWTTVKTGVSNITEGSPPVHEEFSISPRSARYIRIEITSTSAPSSHIFQSIVAEIEAYTSDI